MVYRLIIEGWKQWNEKNYLNGQKKSMEQNRITRGMTGIVFCAIRTIKSILLDGTVSADEIKPLLELSYQLTR